MTFTGATSSVGTRTVSANRVVWTVPSVPPGTTALVLESEAATLVEEPTLVWRNLSTRAGVAVGSAQPVTVASHGPKVIPPTGGYETARYGDRPFPVVPVDYADFKHEATNPASELDSVINDPANPGSTFNLFREMSFGQLFPKGTLGSVKSAGATVKTEDQLVFRRSTRTDQHLDRRRDDRSTQHGAPNPAYT
jgi:hypothetical protein